MDDLRNKPDSYWKERLTPEEFNICRQKGTERAFSGKYDKFYEEGVYVCSCCCCDYPVYDSSTKYDSGTGWPSFWDVIHEHVELKEDKGWFTTRTEVICKRCGGHLGHVFDDGPKPTGKRYCMNSTALKFIPKEK